MDFAEKSRIIDIICWGKIAVGKPPRIFLYQATSEDRALAALEYNSAFQCALDRGILTEIELLTNLVLVGQWDENKENEIEGLKSDLNKLRRGILDYVFQRDKLEVIRKSIRKAENVLSEKLSERKLLLRDSAEAYATCEQQRFLVGRISRNVDGSKLWETQEDFENYTDIDEIDGLRDQYFYFSRFSQSDIREIAKSEPWRTTWAASKSVGNTFGIPVSEFSSSQRELIYWSHVYDIALEAYERPSSTILNDDDLLDSWFIRQSEKVESKASRDQADKVMKQKPGGQEVFIMSDEKGSKDIYKMNDPIARARLIAKQKLVGKKGSVKEQHLPESQSHMRQQLVEMQRQRVKGAKRGR